MPTILKGSKARKRNHPCRRAYHFSDVPLSPEPEKATTRKDRHQAHILSREIPCDQEAKKMARKALLSQLKQEYDDPGNTISYRKELDDNRYLRQQGMESASLFASHGVDWNARMTMHWAEREFFAMQERESLPSDCDLSTWSGWLKNHLWNSELVQWVAGRRGSDVSRDYYAEMRREGGLTEGINGPGDMCMPVIREQCTKEVTEWPEDGRVIVQDYMLEGFVEDAMIPDWMFVEHGEKAK